MSVCKNSLVFIQYMLGNRRLDYHMLYYFISLEVVLEKMLTAILDFNNVLRKNETNTKLSTSELTFILK